jgi:hypothetical protein
MAMAVFLLAAAGCGDDDGSDVRVIDEGGSASGSGSGSGSASGSASGSGSAAEEAECAPAGDSSTADSTVQVELSEFTIETEGEASAGNVAFELVNVGAEPHEMVVVQGASLDDLPTDADGALDEGALESGALIGEVEPFPGEGETCEGTFELEAGDYVLLCNIVEEEDGEVESHLAEGMATTFSVGD